VIRHSVLVGEPGVAPAFGGDPYEAAIESGGGVLRLHPVTGGRVASMEVERWIESDEVDRALVARTRGPVLDVGCGPGRLVRAAILQGRTALGVDVSEAATRYATSRGLPVLRRSVFAPIPGDGGWGAILLADGNIGIGGDPVALLRRCAELAAGEGRIHVETDADPDADRHYLARLSDAAGRRGPVFPWSQLGARRLIAVAAEAGLVVEEAWSLAGRSFSVLRRRADARAA
jgi:SAM-dependent methyltransferase